MITFRTIDLEKDRKNLIEFRKDAFMVSFGNLVGFHERKYETYVKEKIRKFPEGFVLAEEGREVIGQLELSVQMFKNRRIGYVHLFYLTPKSRGKGYSKALQSYAMQFFHAHQINEYHLRVAPGNGRALRFYEKNGMTEIGPELHGKVIRMRGYSPHKKGGNK
ncbi:GNAT family N-acetyltransferase [Halobacillus litoralis]|uniref:GNAT family N-acetyltransferase n=1 Tax=Halobacillus litoralis TaxID=45668 RepID=UPI001CFCC5E2|nr:GNAT family N-acetyltransferase [Halobacillus litoralis]